VVPPSTPGKHFAKTAENWQNSNNMKRDSKGRYNYQRRGIRFPDPTEPTNWSDENLRAGYDDETIDDQEHYNWSNNPVRKLFENPVDSSHRDTIDTDSFNET